MCMLKKQIPIIFNKWYKLLSDQCIIWRFFALCVWNVEKKRSKTFGGIILQVTVNAFSTTCKKNDIYATVANIL